MRALLLISALLLQIPSSPAPEPEPAPSALKISVDVDLVNVLFTVADRRGRLIPSLPKEKFLVFDNNELQVITHFSRETDLPLTIAVLIDISGSVRDKIAFERAAAIEFLESTVRRGTDKVALIAFDSKAELLQDFTDDIAALARATKRIRSGGGTSLYDAVYLAASTELAGHAGRRVEILISDGNDTTSRMPLEAVLKAVQQSDTTIYCISTNSILKNSSRESENGNRTLRRLAEETGGRVFFPAKVDDLYKAFKKLDEELRSQYALSYRPSDAQRDGAFHKIRIETDDRELQINARKGYFARKD